MTETTLNVERSQSRSRVDSTRPAVSNRSVWLVWKESMQLFPLALSLVVIVGMLTVIQSVMWPQRPPSFDTQLEWTFVILPVVFAVGAGSISIGMERENRTLHTLALLPITNRGLVGGKFAVAAAGLLVIWLIACSLMLCFGASRPLGSRFWIEATGAQRAGVAWVVWGSHSWLILAAGFYAAWMVIAMVFAGSLVLWNYPPLRGINPGTLPALLSAFGVAWCGVVTFHFSGSGTRLRPLAEKGVSPTAVWIARHAVPVAIVSAVIVIYTWMATSMVSASFQNSPGDRPAMPSPLQAVLASMLVYSISQWIGQLMKITVLAAIAAPLVALPVVATMLGERGSAPVSVTDCMICVAASLLATWSMIDRFMDGRGRGRATLMACGLTVVWLAVGLKMVPMSDAEYRLGRLPAVVPRRVAVSTDHGAGFRRVFNVGRDECEIRAWAAAKFGLGGSRDRRWGDHVRGDRSRCDSVVHVRSRLVLRANAPNPYRSTDCRRRSDSWGRDRRG